MNCVRSEKASAVCCLCQNGGGELIQIKIRLVIDSLSLSNFLDEKIGNLYAFFYENGENFSEAQYS